MMSNSTAQVLMKKGKRGAASYIHADCNRGSQQHLGPLLDVLLNPNKAIFDPDTIDWCRWLLAGGRTPDEFATDVRSYDKHDKCGLVWIPRVVAYRCRTCGISPCMSICRECFHRGDHSTHDFNMFLSQAGGACDCGDNSVMKEDGFCRNHGNKCPRPGSAPTELMCVAEAMMPRLILRLLQHFREHSGGRETNSSVYRIAVHECEDYVQMLMEFNNMGDLMRGAMTKALINPQMYRNLVEPPFPDTEYGRYMADSKTTYEKAIESFPAPEPPEEYRHLPALAPKLQHNTLLDEFIFWTFKYEFPQNVVCFLLNMLPDQDYKEHLTRTFVLHYARIPLVLEAAADPDTLSNRVVHMSVQLFSNEALALRCVHQLHLLHVMVLSLRLMMGKILVKNTLHDPPHNTHHVIDCTKRVMKEHCYWPLVSDLNNVLSHKSVALVFLQEDALVAMWFEFLSMLQGMNVNVRETGGHIEFEPSSYYAAFSCELEAAAYPMWSVLGHLTEEWHAPLAARIVVAALASLRAWLGAVGYTASAPRGSDVMHASFHFPLHRYLAAFLCAGVRCMGLRVAAVLPAPDLLALIATHPLRVQSLFYEILAGMWVRNGLQIKGQAMTYIQANFCNSMVDMDIYLLQVCAAHMPADQFVDMCIDTFGVREWLSMSPMPASRAAEQDAMVEGLLTFLAVLVSSRTNLGNDELTQSRLEVGTLLAAGDKTHSQLLELMPERSGNAHTRNFEQVLKELSTYRPPPRGSENLEQGLFVPKPEVWERYYDPLHVLRRAVHRSDFRVSMDRFSAYVHEKRKSSGPHGSTSTGASDGGGEAGAAAGAGNQPPAALWPPLRPAAAPPDPAPDPRAICSSGVLHGALLAVLHRGVHRRLPEQSAPHAPAEHALALAVYLLRQAAACHAETVRHARGVCVAGARAGVAAGRPLLAALAGGSVCDHARVLVANVPAARRQRHQRHQRRAPAVPDPDTDTDPDHAPPFRDRDDSDTEWEPPEAEPTTLLPAAEPSTALAVPQDSQMVRADLEVDEQSDAGGDAPTIRAIEEGESEGADEAEGVEEEEDGDGDGEGLLVVVPNDRALVVMTDSGPLHYDEETSEMEWTTVYRRNTPMVAPPSNQIEAEVSDEKSVPVNESIISLLLKLHSQLSGRPDSFSLEEAALAPDTPPDLAPVGDGPHFVGALLRSLAELDSRCEASIAHVRQSLWPHQPERQAEQRAREREEKEERSRRARVRREQLMEEIKRRQQQFLDTMPSWGDEEEPDMEWEQTQQRHLRNYHCVICNISTTNTNLGEDNPIGLCVLLQSTSVLGHRRRAGEAGAAVAATEAAAGARLALSEAEGACAAAQHDATAAAHHYRFHEELQHHFDLESWLLSVNVGWEGGVHVQSCGHHVHLTCLQAYLRSLAAPQRPHNLHVERGEFLCPLCRQLANSVLPLPPRPEPGPAAPVAPVATPPANNVAEQLQSMFEQEHCPPAPSRLFEAMGKAMEDMTATAGGKLKQFQARYGSSPAAIFTFVASLVRTSLECELVQRGGTLLEQHQRYKPRNDCIVPLLTVVGAHVRVLRSAGSGLSGAELWRSLCPPASPPPAACPASPPPVPASAAASRPVPLLLRDPLALLMQLLLLAPQQPPDLPLQYFTCMVQALYALSYYQVVAQMMAQGTAAGRAALAAGEAEGEGEEQAVRGAARLVLGALADSDLFTEDGPPATGADASEGAAGAGAAASVREALLPFLRVAALLRHHLYGDPLPEVALPALESPRLARYLGLGAGAGPGPGWEGTARRWARALARSATRGQLATRRLLRSLHASWAPPALLTLPRDYDRLFTYYHERVCPQCGAVPKEASVCLLCGTLVCLKQQCCRRQDVCEAVQHAMDCGGGTGVFLVVTSTYIIVIRGRRACLWGSLYLDDYDEEDRDLKRGKPLYLSQDRVELLQAQWLAHRFDHTKRTWVWHRDSL